jgi:predicted  nucleic acid-binding Zn-ribbon protein
MSDLDDAKKRLSEREAVASALQDALTAAREHARAARQLADKFESAADDAETLTFEITQQLRVANDAVDAAREDISEVQKWMAQKWTQQQWRR